MKDIQIEEGYWDYLRAGDIEDAPKIEEPEIDYWYEEQLENEFFAQDYQDFCEMIDSLVSYSDKTVIRYQVG